MMVQQKMSMLKRERLLRGILQIDLAKQTGIYPATMSHIETGRFIPNEKVKEKLARALGVSVKKLNSWLVK